MHAQGPILFTPSPLVLPLIIWSPTKNYTFSTMKSLRIKDSSNTIEKQLQFIQEEYKEILILFDLNLY